MLAAGVSVIAFPGCADLLSGQLAVIGGQGQHAVANVLNCACFVCVDVAGNGAIDSLMRTQGSADNGKVGLGATNEKMHVSIRAGEGFFDKLACFVTVRVKTVAVGLLHVCLDEFFEDCRMAAFCIVAVETISHW